MQLPTVETKISEFDARLSRIEGIVEQMNTRLTSLEDRVDNGFRDVQREIRHNMRWVIGIQITTLLTLGTLILFKIG